MKRLFATLAALVMAVGLSGTASAQRGKGGGKPPTTGLEHAETKANPHGQRGIENAETQRAQHKKHKKHRKHHHSH